MAELTDQTLRNINQRLNDMKKALDLSQTSVQQLGKALKEDLSPEQVNAFINALRNVDSGKANKVRLMMELVDDKGNVWNENTAKQRIKDLSNAMETVQKGKKVPIGGVEYTNVERLTASLNYYRKMLEVLKMDSASAFQYVQNLVNRAAGEKKGGEGTAWSRARASEINARKKAIDDVTRTEGQLLKLEQELSKYKEGGSRWKNVKSQIEAANKELEIYREKLKLLASRGKSALDANTGTVGLSKETKQIIQQGREATKEAERLAKVRQKDAQWQEQQRMNTEAQFIANGKAIEQQRKLADQIDILTRKRQALIKYTTGYSEGFDSRNYPLATAYQKQIEDLIRLRQQLDRQFSGSMKAGDLAFANTKTLRDQEEAQKRITAEQKQRDKERADAARQRAAIERKADSESIANQRRQIQIKSQLSAIDKARNSIRDTTSKNAKAQIEAENAEYKRLSAELTRLIARQKELNAISQGSGSRARGRLQTYEITASEQALRRYEEAWRRVNREQKQSDDIMKGMFSTVSRLASAFGVAFSVQGLAQFGKKLVETRGEFELQQVALRSILQNKQLADEIWDKTMQAALQSPFTAMQLTRYTKQLAAYRIENDKLFDTTKRLADVSAGLGVDMGRLILAYGQVKAANYLRASEIRQFTEAGVNILGELSKYLSDVKGKIVSTAQVMDMVQKRMVTFGAVEEVFKRLTDQGGIFYNMQYVQSQTVKGQINKLHDAYDQMLNSIGKANQGTIRNFVGLLNNIVKNWREWKTVLDTIAWPLIITSVYKFSRGLTTAAASAAIASSNVNGLTKAGAKMQLMFQNIKWANVGWMGALTAITAVIAALVNHTKAVKATQQAIYEQNAGLFEQRNQLEKYKNTLEENNNAIKKNSESEEKLKERRAENHSILTKLKNDYPQLAEGIEQMTDGTVKLTDALDRYNKALEDQMTLNYLLSQQSGWLLSDTVKDNLQAWETDMSQIKGELIAMQQAATVGMSRMFTEGKTGEPLYKLLEQIKNIDLSDIIKAREEYEKLYIQIYSLGEYKGSPTGIGVGKYVLPEYTEAFKFIEKFQHDEPTALEDFNKKTLPTIRRIFEENISSFSDYSKEISEKYDDSIVAFIAKNGKIINEGIKNGNKDVVKAIRTALQTAGIGLTEESRNFYNKIINEQIRFEAYQEVLAKQTDKSLKNRLKVMTQVYKDYQQIDFFAAPNTPDSTTPLEDKEGKAKREVEKMISLLKEMHSEYDKLSKSAYGYAKSNDKVKESFQKAFDEVFKVRGGSGTYIDYNKIDITSKKGLANSLQMLYDELAKTDSFAKFGKAFKQELLKAIASANTDVDLEMSVRIREDFGREIEHMFSDYELSLNFEAMGIPEDLAKDLFGIDTSSLDEISSYLQKFATEHAEDWNEDINKIYSDALKKISDKEQEQYKKNVSDLFKRVKSSTDEMKVVIKQASEDINFAQNLFDPNYVDQATKDIKAKIKKNLEEIKRLTPSEGKAEDVDAQQIARLEAENKILENRAKRLAQMYGKISAEQYTDLVRSTIEWENEQIQKVSLEKLKKMPEYITAMGRTAGWTNTKLKEMLEYLENIISTGVDKISLEDYKTITSQINKIQEQMRSNNAPFGLEGFANVANMLRETIEADETLKELEAKRVKLLEEEKVLKEDERLLNNQLNTAKINGDNNAVSSFMSLIQSNQKAQVANQVAQQKVAAGMQSVGKAGSGAAQTLAMIDAIIHAVNNHVQDIYRTMQNIENLLQDYSIDTEHGSWAKWAKGMETFAKASQDATNGWEKFKKGDAPGVTLEVINGIIDIWHGINQIVTQKYDDTIYEQEENIEDLKDAYERLEKQINKTWDSLSYIETYNDQIDNIKEQIDALNAQIAAEEDKKNPDEDKIRDWKNSLIDAEDELDELAQKQKEVFGGIGEEGYLDAAQGFVDAWKQAFLDTGDGLQGLQDHFDEFLQDWFTKQATMLIARKYLDSMFSQIDAAIQKNGNGGVEVMWDEIQKMMDTASEQFPEFSAKLEEFFNRFGGFGEGSLSGLAAGIQGMTEEQANILEAYWNSVRMYAANIDMNVSRIAEMLGIGGPNSNPMLTHLQTIANNTAFIPQIYTLLNNNTKNMGNGRGFVSYQL